MHVVVVDALRNLCVGNNRVGCVVAARVSECSVSLTPRRSLHVMWTQTRTQAA